MKIVYIVVPCYNVEKYVEKCINSLLEQTYKNIKIIAVNDGSTDNTINILNAYKKFIQIIDKQNGGPASARNAALEHISCTKNDFICFVDSDDWVEKDYIKQLVTCSINHDADIVCSKNFVITNHDDIPYAKKEQFVQVLDSLSASKKILSCKTCDNCKKSYPNQ